MAELCPACGREPWYANTAAAFDWDTHCLAHQGGLGKQACQEHELVRLRAEVAAINGANCFVARDPQPIHLHFGLSYASYMVLHRSVLQAMPTLWQRRFVTLLDELDTASAGLTDRPDSFRVLALDGNNRFLKDPYREYRHVRLQLNVEGCGGDGS